MPPQKSSPTYKMVSFQPLSGDAGYRVLSLGGVQVVLCYCDHSTQEKCLTAGKVYWAHSFTGISFCRNGEDVVRSWYQDCEVSVLHMLVVAVCMRMSSLGFVSPGCGTVWGGLGGVASLGGSTSLAAGFGRWRPQAVSSLLALCFMFSLSFKRLLPCLLLGAIPPLHRHGTLLSLWNHKPT